MTNSGKEGMRVSMSIALVSLIMCSNLGASPPAEVWAEYRAWAESTEVALLNGDDAEVVAKYCPRVKWPYGIDQKDADDREHFQLMWRIEDALFRRYFEVFKAPGNADDMCSPQPWEEGAMFIFNWGNWTVLDTIPDPSSRAALEARDIFILVPEALVRVDIDRDGAPEFLYEDGGVTIADGFTVIHDRAEDGRREQWLVAPEGVDPREQVRIWLYRDTPVVKVMADCDGDGVGDSFAVKCLE